MGTTLFFNFSLLKSSKTSTTLSRVTNSILTEPSTLVTSLAPLSLNVAESCIFATASFALIPSSTTSTGTFTYSVHRRTFLQSTQIPFSITLSAPGTNINTPYIYTVYPNVSIDASTQDISIGIEPSVTNFRYIYIADNFFRY